MGSMTMLDRLARAIDPGAYEKDLPVPTRAHTLAFHARRQCANATATAVLHELLTPTEGMVAAGTDLWLGAGNTSADWAAKLTDTHRAMIQAGIEGE